MIKARGGGSFGSWQGGGTWWCDGVKLLIVRGVLESDVIQLLAEELDGVAILAQDTPDANARGVAGDFKHLAEVG